MSRNMIIIIIIIAALIIAGGAFLHMIKESGKRDFERKQEVAAAERQEKAKEVIIKVEAAPIEEIREKMKKFTRD